MNAELPRDSCVWSMRRPAPQDRKADPGSTGESSMPNLPGLRPLHPVDGGAHLPYILPKADIRRHEGLWSSRIGRSKPESTERADAHECDSCRVIGGSKIAPEIARSAATSTRLTSHPRPL